MTSTTLPNGNSLYWKEDEKTGGRVYYSDEAGKEPIEIWDTALVDRSTLLAAIVCEETLAYKEFIDKLNKNKELTT